ncbi:MAG: hypothetical protein AABZ08_01130 [Planctomycetota bacterium]
MHRPCTPSSRPTTGVAGGAHGVMVENHPEPVKASSDGPQALDIDVFRKLMQRIVRRKGGFHSLVAAPLRGGRRISRMS